MGSLRRDVLWAAAAVVVTACAVLLFLYPDSVNSGIVSGIAVSVNTLIPSLFPFLVLSSFVCATPLSDIIGIPFRRLLRALYRIPYECTSVFLLSLVGGYPVGAKLLCGLVEERVITAKQAERLLCLCVNAGPAFVIVGVGAAMFGSVRAGVLLFVSQLVATLLTGLVFRPSSAPVVTRIRRETMSLPAAFVSAVESSARSLLIVCAFVVLFSGVSSMLHSAGITGGASIMLSGLIGVDYSILYALFSGLLEVTNGCLRASSVGGCAGLLLCSLFCSWCGVSVLCQLKAILPNRGIRFRFFLMSRVVHSAVGCIVSFTLWLLFPPDLSVLHADAFARAQMASSPPVFLLLLLMTVMLLSSAEKTVAQRLKK